MVEMFKKKYDMGQKPNFGLFERLGYRTSFKSSKKGNIKTYDATQDYSVLLAELKELG